MDKIIYETKNFVVASVEHPHVARKDGGHLKITPKTKIPDRTKLSPELAIEFVRLTMITGEAMTLALNRRGIDIGRINYQDNGNWSVFDPGGSSFHIHLYGRARSATIQKYGEMMSLPSREKAQGFFDSYESLNEEDNQEIMKEIEALFKSEKYQDRNWHL